ncbi:MAG TPA: nucleotidyltransferase domain-containing protein [Desulfomonilaceae bacterium]|nr:nucleotidyltransferase domain-containing protein [Desulfomonilaceae bacterium]
MNSSVFKWPNRSEVDKAVRTWAAELIRNNPEVIKLGYFGSYARGDWGVGSDLDLIAIVERSEEAFEKRSLNWDVNELPVPAQVIVYTLKEWELFQQEGNRFALTLARETVWVHGETHKGVLMGSPPD